MRASIFGKVLALAAALGAAVPAPTVLADDYDGGWRHCRDLHGRERWRCEEARRDRWRERQEKQDKKDLKAGLAAGAIGLALGAIIIGAAQEAERKREAEAYRRNDRDARCLARYRSYDPRSGTFIGRDGRRYECR
ncbi:BA14K family protein [Ensifer sp. NPDC090286]|uniref:BA14K family protein n=1 Tax=Ensifer sp. NPDC090286 TaxID=3363991 RepID=UPI00383B6615